MQQLKRNKRGLESDTILLDVIREQHGLSQYEISRKLKWPSGRVDGSIRRLLNENKIVVKILERNGRRVNLVYPKENKPSNFIEIPEKLLCVGNGTWQSFAYVYALDSQTIGISGHEMPEWAEISCLKQKIPIQQKEEKVVVQIPEKLSRFYNLERKHKVVTLNGNNILVTISGNIIEEKKYPT